MKSAVRPLSLASRNATSGRLQLSRTTVRPNSTDAAPSQSSVGSRFRRAAAALSVAATAYSFGAFYPPQMLSFIYPRAAPPPPHPESPTGIAMTMEIEEQLQTLTDVVRLRSDPDNWYETRPHLKFPEERRVNSLTAGALRGPGKLAVAPITFATHDDSEAIGFLHLGRGLCGHDGIIHGGLLATLLDESLARTAVLNLPNKIGVTANLNLNYRAPTKADQFVKVTSTLVEKKGRKAVVKGKVEDLNGNLLAEATAVFIEPKYASMLNSSPIAAALGKSPKTAQGAPIAQEAAV